MGPSTKAIVPYGLVLAIALLCGVAEAQLMPVRASGNGPLPYGTLPRAAPDPSFALTILARSGDEPPQRPGEVFTTFTNPAVNAQGDLLVVFKGNFDGPLSGNEGLYGYTVATNLFRWVDDSFDFSPPGQGGASSWTGFGPPALSGGDEVLFEGGISFGDGNHGLFATDAGTLQLIFDDSPLQPVPGQPGANGFTIFPFSAGFMPLLGTQGHGVTTARFFDAGFVSREGVYVGRASEALVRVTDELQSPPGQPAAQFTTFDPFMAVGPDGDVGLHAEFTGGIGTHGIYRYDQAAALLRRVADRTTPVPGQAGGARFTVMDGFVSTNVSRKIWFRASYSGGLGSQGLYRGDGVGSLEVLVDGSGAHAVPGNPGKTFQAFGFPAANRVDQTVFSATYGPAAAEAGLFLRQAGGSITKIVDFDDPVPGQPGAQLFAAGSVSVNRHGHVAVAARYSGGSGDEGVYFYDGHGLFLVADETTDFGGATATNLHLLTTTGGSGGEDGRPRALHDDDAIVFRAELSDGDEVVVLATRR